MSHILRTVVLGALLLTGLYALFGDVVLSELTRHIQECSIMPDRGSKYYGFMI